MTKNVRVADYIAESLRSLGIKHVFLVTGGGAMHLNDAFGRCEGMTCIPCHHEQACAFAAESYFRLTNRMAAVNVTSGPGSTNAITGVYGAFVDSLGMVVISGNVKWETLVRSTKLNLRQLGDQEIDIVKLVAPITKYAEMVADPVTIRYHLERALHLAVSGRPGPVWLDIPLNVQGALIDPSTMPSYDPREDAVHYSTDLSDACSKINSKLQKAERPVLLVSSGVRISGAYDDFLRLVERWGIPVTTAWNAHDLVWNDHPCYVGRQGIVGDRAGNFAVQNADLLISLGCRLSVRQVGYNWNQFARKAYKIMVEIDAAELQKPTIQPDLPIHANVADVIRILLNSPYPGPTKAHKAWLDWCVERKREYPVVLPEYWNGQDAVNPYCFMEALFHQLEEDEIIVCGDGTACVVTFQAANLKKGQRLYHNSGCAPMGYDLPAAVGACFASDRRRIICITGDGSIQMNVQELQVIATHGLPIKLFVLNNQGYHSIRQTQQNYFKDNIVGCGPDSGLGFPNFERLAEVYGLAFRRSWRHDTLQHEIAETLQAQGPALCEIVLDITQEFAPKVASRKLPDGRMISSPLEDMTPLLPRAELRRNMVIPLIEDV